MEIRNNKKKLIFTAVRMTMFFWVLALVLSIFRAEVAMPGSGGIFVALEEEG